MTWHGMAGAQPALAQALHAPSSAWLEQVERWLTLITERAIQRHSFTSVRELKQQIELFVQRYNADASPFHWLATADSMLHKIERIAKRIPATAHHYAAPVVGDG